MSEVTMKAPKGVTSAGVAGVQYEVDKSGRVQVAQVHVKALLDHGFAEVTDADAQDAAPRARRARAQGAAAGEAEGDADAQDAA